MEYVNIESWSRREAFEFFSAVSNPFYSVTFNLDVSKLYDYTKKQGISFYYALTYLATQAVNSVENFLYSIEGGKIVRYEKRIPSFTDLKKGSDNFYMVTMECEGSIDEFCAAAKAKSEAQTVFLDTSSEGADLIFFSCLPWVELTALTNERNFDRDDSIPRIAWGKYHEENGRKILGMSLELNHRLVDGVHIGKFAQALETLIADLS